MAKVTSTLAQQAKELWRAVKGKIEAGVRRPNRISIGESTYL